MINPTHLPLKPRWLSVLLEKVLGLHRLGKIYDGRPETQSPQEFLDYTLAALGVSKQITNPANLDDIPRTGALLIVANHPLGGLGGMVLAQVISRVRPDLQVLTNQLLRRIPELAPLFIGVDVLSADAAAENISGIKKVHGHLKSGGAMLIFPAGMVSAYEPDQDRIVDRPWNRLVGQLVNRYQCSCIPIYVGGKNSSYFYTAGRIHPRLRTLLLPRQLANKQGFELPLTIGRVIPVQEFRHTDNPRAITEYLRVSTDALTGLEQTPQPGQVENSAVFATDICSDKLSDAMANLVDLRLIEHEDFDVYCAPFDRLGPVMEQIAIAREVTFRSVGEGTGNSTDSDEFDPHYLHLFLWDKQLSRIAGAYRVGLVDKIYAEHGVHGLYSRSLYEYDHAFLKRLGSAIEMGRSFIHPDYQRKPIALTLLWRGIGRLLVDNPQYHTLFGSVSISREYSDLARALIADAMLSNYKARGFEELVKPITPHKVGNRVWSQEMLSALSNIKMLGKLIGRCDPGKALPVLLRHYLSLNGRLVCFNIHSKFNNSLEGLIIVDVRQTDAKTTRRFMGVEGYQQFISAHKLQDSA